MTLLKDLVDIPERVAAADFVVRLASEVDDLDAIVAQYVVTDQLVGAFDEALKLVRDAVSGQRSVGAYLHGSFGSGKSHFMAILYGILSGHAGARQIPELQAVIAHHADWLSGKRFLMVPYHMLGASSLESAIFGGYARFVQDRLPEAPTPGVYVSDDLLRDAQGLREAMGDDAFFARLNGDGAAGTTQPSDWGALAGTSWDAESFQAAASAPATDAARAALVGRLVEVFFTATRTAALAGEHGAGFLPLDDGLSVISRHARAQGFDAVVLFLDELILWLASHGAEPAFVNREGSKITKLVEAEVADRPAPIVSFMARQRDLAELVGDTFVGAHQMAISQTLQHGEARFSAIRLEDRNLPQIAERRVLAPKSPAARQEIDAAFRQTESYRQEVMDILLGPTGDREQFRRLYPFSPALVEALVALSSLLQRERTAIKVMVQMLSARRDSLTLGDVLPVGDLYDAVTEGADSVSLAMKQHLSRARQIYLTKLQPAMEAMVSNVADAAQQERVRLTIDRLVKTLMLAALAPNVPALSRLTAAKLAALNHGTIRSPIPGQEAGTVLRHMRTLAAQVGEVRITGDDADPVISLQLASVDTEPILRAALAVDNTGNRQQKVRDLVFELMGIEVSTQLYHRHVHTYRGLPRQMEVVFGNVRECPDEVLAQAGDSWKLVIDFPFDEPGFGPNDDLARLDRFLADNSRGARTLVWVPTFLSQQAREDLGKLVILDHVLTGDRLANYAGHLGAVDRQTAKMILENQQAQLHERVKMILEGAYGMAAAPENTLDRSHGLAEHVRSLDPGFRPAPPVGADLKGALGHLLEQAIGFQYPAQPDFSGDIRLTLTNLKKVLEIVQRACREEGQRIVVEQPLRPLVKVVVHGLELGSLNDNILLLSHKIRQLVEQRRAALPPGQPLTAGAVKRLLDEPQARGLTPELANLAVLFYAELANCSFRRLGAPATPVLENLPDDVELVAQRMPKPADWDVALHRAGAIFGVAPPPFLSAGNVQLLAKAVQDQASAVHTACEALPGLLAELWATWGHPGPTPERLRTARAVQGLLTALAGADADAVRVVEVVAAATVDTSEAAMGASLKKAPAVVQTLSNTNWPLLSGLRARAESGSEAARQVLQDIAVVLAADEYAVGMSARLTELESRATAIIVGAPSPPPAVHPPTPPEPPPLPPVGGPADRSRSRVRARPGGMPRRRRRF